MKQMWYGTQEEYDNLKTPFREAQQSKSRYHYHGDTINGEWVEWTTPRKMTNTWKELQREYNMWSGSKLRHDTLYFVTQG